MTAPSFGESLVQHTIWAPSLLTRVTHQPFHEVADGVYEPFDPNDPAAGGEFTYRYWARFEVDDQGVVSGSVRTVTSDNRYRSPNQDMRLGTQFQAALRYFRQNYIQKGAQTD